MITYADTKQCPMCETRFTYGPGTSRDKAARYCTDACARKARLQREAAERKAPSPGAHRVTRNKRAGA